MILAAVCGFVTKCSEAECRSEVADGRFRGARAEFPRTDEESLPRGVEFRMTNKTGGLGPSQDEAATRIWKTQKSVGRITRGIRGTGAHGFLRGA